MEQVLESATVIQDTSSRAGAVLNVYGGTYENSRAARFYRMTKPRNPRNFEIIEGRRHYIECIRHF